MFLLPIQSICMRPPVGRRRTRSFIALTSLSQPCGVRRASERGRETGRGVTLGCDRRRRQLHPKNPGAKKLFFPPLVSPFVPFVPSDDRYQTAPR
jgi:hypothetical protein